MNSINQTLPLTATQMDRACGALLGAGVGDALGAGYEFGSAPFTGTPAMIGGGLGHFTPAEWTDDTAQSVAIALVAATGVDLRSPAALDAVAAQFARWFAGNPPDVGIQTRAVLNRAGVSPDAATMAAAARAEHDRTGRSAGNGSLMRTAPVALAHLADPAALVQAARAVSALTHADPVAGEGAALWCLMIRHAVLHDEFPTAEDVLGLLGETRYDWAGALAEAERVAPAQFTANGWVVGALQAAWASITQTPVPTDQPCRHLQDVLATAIGIGHDTDTVAAIAGALVGARWGASSLPQEWLLPLHGWGLPHSASGEETLPSLPGGAAGLTALATLVVRGGRPDRQGWPTTPEVAYPTHGASPVCVPHPLVDGVWIGNSWALADLPEEIDAVVSLCRMGTEQAAGRSPAAVVRLIDSVPEENPHRAFVIDDAARTVLRLRKAGHQVFLHCVAGQSRTPTVAARVAVLEGHDLDVALRTVVAMLPGARPQRWLVDTLREL